MGMPSSGPSLPAGLQALLSQAARDEKLRRDLLARRDAAAGDVALTPSERAVLRAVPEAQLRQMIAAVTALPPPPDRRDFLRQAGSAAVVLLGGAALGGTALGPAEVCATPPRPSPPTGIRPDPPYFTGDVDVVDYRTVSGPARPLPDEAIERNLADHGLRDIPRAFEGRLAFRLVVDEEGRVTKATPEKPPEDRRAAAEKLAADLTRTRFKRTSGRTTMTFAVVLSKRQRLREWSGKVDLVDLDVIGLDADRLRRAVRALVPELVAHLKAAEQRFRPGAGKLRYAVRVEVDGQTVDAQLTKNTSVPHVLAMSLRQRLTELRLPKPRGTHWCRFSLVLVPVP
jgi:hypothetical protein